MWKSSALRSSFGSNSQIHLKTRNTLLMAFVLECIQLPFISFNHMRNAAIALPREKKRKENRKKLLSQDRSGVNFTGWLQLNPGVVSLCQHGQHCKRNITFQYLLPGNGPQKITRCPLVHLFLPSISMQPKQTEGSNLSPTPICWLELLSFWAPCPSSPNVSEPCQVIPQVIMPPASPPRAALQRIATLHLWGTSAGVQQ